MKCRHANLEAIRKDPALFKQFIRERVKGGQDEGNQAVFEAAMASAPGSASADGQSLKSRDASFSEPQARANASPDTVAKH